MSSDKDLAIAICWYQPEEWLKIKKSAADADAQDDSYEEWKSNANRAIENIRATGHTVAKIAMKAEEISDWCSKNNTENNADARSRFAAMKLEKRKHETCLQDVQELNDDERRPDQDCSSNSSLSH